MRHTCRKIQQHIAKDWRENEKSVITSFCVMMVSLRKGQCAVEEFKIAGEADMFTYVPGTRGPNLPQTPDGPV